MRDQNRKTDEGTHVFTLTEEEILKMRALGFREKTFGKEFKPIKKETAVRTQFLRRLERMSQAEMFEFMRSMKPEEVASLPKELQLQAQAVRASQKDSIRTEDFNRRADFASGDMMVQYSPPEIGWTKSCFT